MPDGKEEREETRKRLEQETQADREYRRDHGQLDEREPEHGGS